MARIRTIKPEFFTSEDIVSRSPMARLLYIALWCEADKEGRLVWKPATFKLRYLPGDNCDVSALCDELVSAGLVVLYGDGYAHIPTFKAHQHINPRESASQLPDPVAFASRGSRVGTRRSRDSDAQGGREGKGREGNELTTSIEVVGARPSAEAPHLALVEGSEAAYEPPDCPHLQVLSVWAEVLPAMPQHEPTLWQGARSDRLRARWRETAAAKRWPDQAAGIAYFRKLFAYVGQSAFLTGRAKQRSPDQRPFMVELEWLVKPSNWAKVLEGKYHQEAA